MLVRRLNYFFNIMRIEGIKTWKQDINHKEDNLTNLGYLYYKDGIFKNVLSPEIFSNPKQDKNYRQLERIMIYLIDLVKQIKLQYSIAHDKDTIYIN